MADAGKYMSTTLLGSHPRVHAGKCKNCGYALDLYEMDVKRSSKVMRCERCGLLHIYRKDIVGKWRLQKAVKPELVAR